LISASWSSKQNGLFVRDVEYDESAEVYSVDIGIRIDDEGGHFLGVMKIVFNIEGSIDIIKEAAVIGRKTAKTIYFKLITKKGKLIYSPKKFTPFENIPEDIFLKIKSGGQQGYFVASEHEEPEELFSFSHSEGYKNYKGLDWILIVEHESEDIFSTVAKLRNILFLIFFSAMILAIVLGLIVSRDCYFI